MTHFYYCNYRLIVVTLYVKCLLVQIYANAIIEQAKAIKIAVKAFNLESF